MLKGQKFRSYK